MLTKELPSLVERYLSQAGHFTPASHAPLPSAFAKLDFQPGEQCFGVWRAAGLRERSGIIISSLGVWGCFDDKMTFVRYSEISDLRIPDTNDPSDARMREIMLYTHGGTCIFFPLFDSQRDQREAAILFRFLSAIISLQASAVFRGVSTHPARNSQPVRAPESRRQSTPQF